MQKIVINPNLGGFALSHAAVMRYAELAGILLYPYIIDSYRKIYKDVFKTEVMIEDIGEIEKSVSISCSYSLNDPESEEDRENFYDFDIERNDPALVQVVKEMANDAHRYSDELKIIKIPDGVEWEIQECDGNEWIAEKHRTWR